MTALPDDFIARPRGVVAFATGSPNRTVTAGHFDTAESTSGTWSHAGSRSVTCGRCSWTGASGTASGRLNPFRYRFTGDVRVDVQAGLAMLAPIWGYRPLLDIDDATARDQLARLGDGAVLRRAVSARHLPAGRAATCHRRVHHHHPTFR